MFRQFVKAKMTPLKIHNCGSYSLMEYLEDLLEMCDFLQFSASCFCITLKCFFLITIKVNLDIKGF